MEKSSNNTGQPTLMAEPRYLLAVKARWFILGLLVLFGVITSVSNTDYYAIEETLRFLTWPALTIILAILYNSALHYSWYAFPQLWSEKLKLICKVQILLDVLVATLLIHFTGGAGSWFWTLYVLITIEVTYLLPNLKEIIIFGLVGSASYSLLLALEYFDIISVFKMPYMATDLHRSPAYIAIVWIWVHLLNISIALVSIDIQRKKSRELEAKEIKDNLTGAYNLSYFNQALSNEIQRAKRYERPVSLLLLDIDDFSKYKVDKSEGEANELIIRLAHVLATNIRRHRGDTVYDVDILCRYEHDKFAIILPETAAEASSKDNESAGAVTLAKRLMGKVAEVITSETGITVSIGIAGYPYHALEAKSLVQATVDATKKAKSLGKHRIMVAPVLPAAKKVPVN